MDHQILKKVSELFDLSQNSLDELVSWSPSPREGVRMQFRGDEVISRTLINPKIRGCPQCLREDVQDSAKPPSSQMVMRGEWQFEHVKICHEHKRPLVALWNETNRTNRYDYATNLKEIWPKIHSEQLDPEPVDVTSYDTWLINRLKTNADDTFLGRFQVDVAARFCELLGQDYVEAREVTSETNSLKITARSVGFEIAAKGKAAIIKALVAIVLNSMGPPSNKGKKTSRHLYNWLAFNSVHDRRYDHLRTLQRNALLDTWPYAANTKLLGKLIKSRKLHSITTAAKELNISSSLLRGLLVGEGIIAEHDTRSDARATFEAHKLADLAVVLKRCVREIEFRKALGCTKDQLGFLVSNKILSPRFDPQITRKPWDLDDAKYLREKLTSSVISINSEDDGWEHIHTAATRRRIDIKLLFDHAQNGEIKVGLMRDCQGYAAIHVSSADAKEFQNANGPKSPTVAEFERSLGLHNSGSLKQLIRGGFTPATELFNPRTARIGLYITESDAAAFHARFTTSKVIAARLGVSNRKVTSVLKRSGTGFFNAKGREFLNVYLLADAEKLIEDRLQ